MGRYRNFPEVIHGVARFACESPMIEVQQAIIVAFHHLNHKVCDLGAVALHLPQKCEVGFEIGIAEGFGFNFLDKEEVERFQKSIAKREFSILDFFLVLRYHVVNEQGKRVPLKFDYHLLRFKFQEALKELRVYHERGTQKVPLEDLIIFVTKRINEELCKKLLKPLALEYLRAL